SAAPMRNRRIRAALPRAPDGACGASFAAISLPCHLRRQRFRGQYIFADHDCGASSMTEPSGHPVTAAAPSAGQTDTAAEASLFSQLDMMIRALWASPARGAIVAIT